MVLKINKHWGYFLTGLVLFLAYLIIRYAMLGYDMNLLIITALFWFTAVGLLFYSNLCFRDPINPITAYSVYIFLFGYSIIPMSSMQKEYSFTTYAIIILSIISFLLPIFLNVKILNIKVPVLGLKTRVKLLHFLLIASCLVFVLECVNFGFVPILEVASRNVYSETNKKLLPFLHYFIVLNSYIPCWAYIFYKKRVFTKKHFCVVLLISLFILMNYLSRQVYLLFGISFFIAYCYYNKVKFSSILKICLLVISLFLSIGFLKFHSPVTDSFSEYMRLIADIDNDEINLLESTFVEYSSKRYVALDLIVEAKDNLEYYGLGIYTFRPLLSLFLLEKFGLVNRIPELDSESLVTTYAADPYLDFGYLGVIVLNFFYGALALGCYQNFKGRKSVAIVSWSIILFCCFMGMFVNYYNTMLIWLGLSFNQFLFYKLDDI